MAGASFPFAVVISAVDKLTGPVGRMEGSLGKLSKGATRVGRTLTFGVSAPIIAAGALAVGAGASFEKGMSRVEALTGAAGAALASLKAEARELGRTTQYSAGQAASAMAEFAVRGFEVQDILAATPPTLALAAAADTELAEAARLAAGVLRAQGKDTKEFGYIVDLLTTGFTRSANEFAPFAEALATASPVARAAGVPLKDLAAVFFVLGENMQQGAEAGTGIRRVLTNLADLNASKLAVLRELKIDPDELFSNGKVQGGILDIARRLRDAGANLEHVNKLFGQFGGPKILTLIQAGEGALAAAEEKLADVEGRAEDVASVMLDNTAGAAQILTSALESLNITLGETGLLKSVRQAIERFTVWVGAMEKADPAVLKLAVGAAAVLAVLGPTILTLGLLGQSLLSIKAAALLVWPALAKMGAVLFGQVIPSVVAFTAALLTNPIFLVGAAIAAVIAGLVLLVKHWDLVVSKVKQVGAFLADFFLAPLNLAVRKLQELVDVAPDWLIGLFGGSSATGPASARGAAASSESLRSAAGSTRSESVERRESRVFVRFDGLPAGARVVEEGDANLDLDIGLGLAT